MKKRVQFTEQVVRFRDYLPAADRQNLIRLIDRIAANPEGPETHLAYTTDTVTRSAWDDGVMVHYVVTAFWVVVIEADIYDAARGYNEI
ncbi:hypothetical protein [Streptomyces sp. cg36]|uniref:hypothetical protein n=1 Tax=Streptomyces sp. cg36 TaxID=3238798 RepID=UPI0034E1E6B5